jgi:hypothetical protein
MALLTRTQKTMQRIGIARGNLAFLNQSEVGRMGAILGRYADWYRITASSMTKARSAAGATSEDCAAALIANLDRLTIDASFIKGFTPHDSRRVNPHLHVLGAECAAFALAQATGADINGATTRFLERGLGTGSFAGSAFV